MASSSSRSYSARSKSGQPNDKKLGQSDRDSESGKTKRGRGTDDEGWGGFKNYMEAKKQKLSDQFYSDKQDHQSDIFEGVRIYVNGYTKPSSDELRRIMQKHGGKYEMYLSKSRVTHIVATNLPNSKLHQAKTIPVVRPEWITDSVTAARRLPHTDYLLFGKQSKLQAGLKFSPSVATMSRSSSATSLYSEESTLTRIKDQMSRPEGDCVTRNEKDMANGPDGGSVEKAKRTELEESVEKAKRTELEESVEKAKRTELEESVEKAKRTELEESVEKAKRTELEESVEKAKRTELEESVEKAKRKELEESVEKAKRTELEENVVNAKRTELEENVEKAKRTELEESVEKAKRTELEESVENINRIDLKGESRKSLIVSERLCPDDLWPKKMVGEKDKELEDCAEVNCFVQYRMCKRDKRSSIEDCCVKEQQEKEKKLEQEEGISNSSDDSDIVLDSEDEIDSPGKYARVTFSSPRTDQSLGVAAVRDSKGCQHEIHIAKQTTSKCANAELSLTSVNQISNKDDYPSTPINTETGKGHEVLNTANRGQIHAETSNKSNGSDLKSPFAHSLKDGATLAPLRSLPSPHRSVPSSGTGMAKAGDKHFLSEFYSNSRLHHLSTWGAEFKAYVAEIQKCKGAHFPGRERLRQAHVENVHRLGMPETLETARHSCQERTVMHIDMDCFFVSVGLLSRPDLRGKPVAVTHSRGQGSKPDPASDAAWEKAEWQRKRDGKLKTQTPDKGDKKAAGPAYDQLVAEGSTGTQTFHSMAEIASCSYEARQKGVKNGMFMGRAKSLCPDLQTIPYDFAEYNRISKILYDTVASYTHDIEAVSCDEMLVDCTDLLTDTGATPMEFASLLRSDMVDKTGCTASTGIGPNVLLAKLATRRAKPNGQFQVLRWDAKMFIKDQNVSDLPGVGYSMSRKLSKLGVKTCGDLQALPVGRLRREFGPKTGESLHQFSLGHDDREVRGDKRRKSVSAEVNYGIRFTKESEAVIFLQELSNEVHQRLVKLRVKGHVITLKLMVRRQDAPQETAKFMGHGICNTVNKSTSLPVATNDGGLIGREVIAMYKSHKVAAADIRGIGIQVQKLEPENCHGSGSGKQVREHQSILNFAVAGKENGAQVSTSRPKLTNRESSFSMESELDAKEISGPSSICRSGFVMSSESVKRGATSAPGLEQSTSSKEVPGFQRAGPNVEDGAMADSGLPDHIDLDTLTDVSFLLTPSQVNADVLKELPEEIANEIRADMEQHATKTRLRTSRSSNSDSVLDKQPEPSRRSAHQGTDVFRHRGESCEISLLPSVSQVDFACFQALPKHMQLEIQAAYTRQSRKDVEVEDRTALVGTALSRLKSPSKGQSGKQKKTGKRRGRPPGRKKLTFSDLQGSKIVPIKNKVLFDGNSDTPITSDVIIVDDVELNDEESEMLNQGCPNDMEFNDTEFTLTRNSSTDASVVSFCGAETVCDVRSLLKEWLNSCQDPGQDDVSMVTDYLISLIQANMLEQAYCHLRFLIRCVNSRASLYSWKESVDNIASHVQSCVWDLYGSDFKLYP